MKWYDKERFIKKGYSEYVKYGNHGDNKKKFTTSVYTLLEKCNDKIRKVRDYRKSSGKSIYAHDSIYIEGVERIYNYITDSAAIYFLLDLNGSKLKISLVDAINKKVLSTLLVYV